MKKFSWIFVLGLLVSLISFGKVFAAENAAIYLNDEKSFKQAFNDSAKKNGAGFTAGEIETLSEDADGAIYALSFKGEDAGIFAVKDKNNKLRKISVIAAKEEVAAKSFKIILDVLNIADTPFQANGTLTLSTASGQKIIAEAEVITNEGENIYTIIFHS